MIFSSTEKKTRDEILYLEADKIQRNSLFTIQSPDSLMKGGGSRELLHPRSFVRLPRSFVRGDGGARCEESMKGPPSTWSIHLAAWRGEKTSDFIRGGKMKKKSRRREIHASDDDER